MTTDKVLDKLSKLKASRDGEAKLGNSAAAEAFAEAISRLLLQHELREVDIPLTPEQDPIVEQLVDLEAHGIKKVGARIGWQEALARIVAPAHLCQFLVSKGSNRIWFVGTKAHTTIAEYAYGVLASSADRMSRDARDEYWRVRRDDPDFVSGNFRAAWLSGFVERIAERFAEARRAEVRAAASNSTTLVRLDQALVRAKQHVDDKFKGKNGVPSASMSGGISAGYRAGRNAADDVAVGRKGVSASRQKRLR